MLMNLKAIIIISGKSGIFILQLDLFSDIGLKINSQNVI